LKIDLETLSTALAREKKKKKLILHGNSIYIVQYANTVSSFGITLSKRKKSAF